MKPLLQFSRMVAILCAGAVLGLPATPTVQEVNLRGTFNWSNEKSQKHDLLGKLIATGTNAWQAVWNFTWKQRPMTLTGIVKGDLRNGPITGTGDMANGKRHFTFEGKATDGTITFEHYEVTRGKNRTGSGELRLTN